MQLHWENRLPAQLLRAPPIIYGRGTAPQTEMPPSEPRLVGKTGGLQEDASLWEQTLPRLTWPLSPLNPAPGSFQSRGSAQPRSSRACGRGSGCHRVGSPRPRLPLCLPPAVGLLPRVRVRASASSASPRSQAPRAPPGLQAPGRQVNGHRQGQSPPPPSPRGRWPPALLRQEAGKEAWKAQPAFPDAGLCLREKALSREAEFIPRQQFREGTLPRAPPTESPNR